MKGRQPGIRLNEDDASDITSLSTIDKYFSNKKKKREVRDPELIGMKPKVSKQKSEKNKMIQKMLAMKTDKTEFLDEYLSKNNIQLTADQKKYFYAINKLRSDYNKRISIPKSLISNRIYIYYLIKNVKYYFISNDLLTNIAMFYVSNNNWKKLGFEKCVTMENATICSSDTINKDLEDTEIHECYIEDMNTNISFVGLNENSSEEEISKIIQEPTVKKIFKYNNDEYTILTKVETKQMIVYKNKEFEDNAKKIYEAIKRTATIHREKGELKKGFKPINKKEGVFFFQQTMALTDFCPSIVITKEEVLYNILYKLEINPEELLNYYTTGEGEKVIYNNLINFENLEEMMAFFNVLRFVTQLKEGVTDMINNYNKSIKIIAMFKKEYIDFKTIVITFYDSFMYKLNIDVILKIFNLCNKFINQSNIFKKYEVNTEYQNFIEQVKPYGQTLYNFLKYPKGDFIKTLYSLCNDIINNTHDKQVDFFSNAVRTMGLTMYDMFFQGKINILNTIRSPFSFLTNIIGDSQTDTLRKNLTSLIQKYSKEGENIIQHIENFNNRGNVDLQILQTSANMLKSALSQLILDDSLYSLSSGSIQSLDAMINAYNTYFAQYDGENNGFPTIYLIKDPSDDSINNLYSTCMTYATNVNNTDALNALKNDFDFFKQYVTKLDRLSNIYAAYGKINGNDQQSFLASDLLKNLYKNPTENTINLFLKLKENKKLKITDTLKNLPNNSKSIVQHNEVQNNIQQEQKDLDLNVNNNNLEMIQEDIKEEEKKEFVKKGDKYGKKKEEPKSLSQQRHEEKRDKRSASKSKELFKTTSKKEIKKEPK